MINISKFYVEGVSQTNIAIDISVADKVSVTLYTNLDGQLVSTDKVDYEFSDLFNGDGKQKSVFFTYKGQLTEAIDLGKIKVREGLSVLDLLGVNIPALQIKFNSMRDKYVVVSTVPFIEGNTYSTTTDTDINAIYTQVFGVSFGAFPSEAAKFKSKMLFELSPNDNLAILEAQLDVVTDILFKLLDKLPDETIAIFNEYPQLLDAKLKISTTSVLTVKSMSKCLQEIERKNKIRELQQKYYNLK